jgi:hypothetical protein
MRILVRILSIRRRAFDTKGRQVAVLVLVFNALVRLDLAY